MFQMAFALRFTQSELSELSDLDLASLRNLKTRHGFLSDRTRYTLIDACIVEVMHELNTLGFPYGRACELAEETRPELTQLAKAMAQGRDLSTEILAVGFTRSGRVLAEDGNTTGEILAAMVEADKDRMKNMIGFNQAGQSMVFIHLKQVIDGIYYALGEGLGEVA